MRKRLTEALRCQGKIPIQRNTGKPMFRAFEVSPKSIVRAALWQQRLGTDAKVPVSLFEPGSGHLIGSGTSSFGQPAHPPEPAHSPHSILHTCTHSSHPGTVAGVSDLRQEGLQHSDVAAEEASENATRECLEGGD